jgi:hypothetical protein
MHSQYPRLQGTVKLDQGGQPLLEVKYEAPHHPSTCHLQRHPEYGRADRLIRAAFDKQQAGSCWRSSSGSSSRQQDAAAAGMRKEAVKAVLSHGLIVAGRRYQRWVWGGCCWLLLLLVTEVCRACGPLVVKALWFRFAVLLVL